MAITSVGPFWIHGPIGGKFGVGFANTNVRDEALEAWGYVFRVPRTGTLHSVEFRIGSVFNAPDNGLKVSFQDVDSSGLPDGTPDQYRVVSTISGNTWTVPPGPLTSDGTDDGTKRSVTLGDYLAVVIEYDSYVAGDSYAGSMAVFWGNTSQARSNQHYLVERNNAGTWSSRADAAVTIALKYDDGTYAYIGSWDYPYSVFDSAAYSSSSTPDERGLRFVLPFGARVIGGWARVGLSAAADLVLYDDSNNVKASSSLDSNVATVLTAPYSVIAPFTPTELAAGTYRLIFKPTTTSNVTLYHYDVPSNDHFAATEGGIGWYYTQRTDGGAWTDTDTKRPLMGLLFDGVDVSGGGGGGGAFSYAFMG